MGSLFFRIQERRQASNYILFSKSNIYMEDTTSLECQFEGDSTDRPFQCPCGRNYRSYPALFTHVKNKHHGKPPGPIKRPALPTKRRGRPPSHPKHSIPDSTNSRYSNQPMCEIVSLGQKRRKSIKDLTTDECLSQLADLLQNLSKESWSRKQLNQIQAIIEMNVYLVTKGNDSGCPIGKTICQFLQGMSGLVQWQKFQQLYMLLMVFLQFIIDQLGNRSIISEGSIDLLCDYINDFVQHGVEPMARQYHLQQLPVFRENYMLEIFGLFFQWLMSSGHTMYKISLNQHFKRVETKAEI